MSTLSLLAMDLAASIWYQQGTFEELYERKIESLKTLDQYMFFRIIIIAKEKKWIYLKGETYRCYKATVKKVLNPAGYEIELPTDTRSEFRKEFDRQHGF